MKKTITILLKICCVLAAITLSPTQIVFGQTKALIDTSLTPNIFAAKVVSSPYTEWATSFTPDEKTVFFCRGNSYWTICYARFVDGQWLRPMVASFSGKYSDTDPFVSPDGKRLFFISNRPFNADIQSPQKVYHLWYVDHIAGDKWSSPKYVNGPINRKENSVYAPSVSSSGTIFFCARGRDGKKGMASYCSKWVNDHYDEPQQLLLLGNEEVQDPFSAPDESYIIFVSGNDLYYSAKDGDHWGVSISLGPQVNNGDSNSSPYVSRDGKKLYYTSGRVQGFYKRDPKIKALDFDEIQAESHNIFNTQGNILYIPVNLPPYFSVQ
jgi:hypothetical protein